MISSCIRTPLFQGMNLPSCKAGSNNRAELLPTSWLPLALSTPYIIYHHLYSLLAAPLSSLRVCGWPNAVESSPTDIQGDLLAHNGPSYYKDQVAGLRSCYLLPSAMSLSCCWISSPVSLLLLLQKQRQYPPPCISRHDTINLIFLSIVSVINALVRDKLLNRGKTESCLWIVWIPNRNRREEKKKTAGVQANQLSLDSRMTFGG